jgi:predicted ATPase
VRRMVRVMDGRGVVGRDAELGSIDAFVDDVPRGPTALVLAGEAGIGKTILWEAGVEAARRRYGRVLTCRGVEAEAALSFSGLSQLLTPVLAETLESLAPPRRRALEVALLLVEPGEVGPDAHAIGLAVLDVLRAVAGRGPIVVALDDVQWLDPASAGALRIALRRVHEEPLGVFITVREASGPSVPVELERCFDAEQLRREVVGPRWRAPTSLLLPRWMLRRGARLLGARRPQRRSCASSLPS